MKILNAIFYGKYFILTPFKGTENRFSISCLICTNLTLWDPINHIWSYQLFFHLIEYLCAPNIKKE